jgi:RNA polymerase sigma-70 factor (ECF subfamily)
LVATRQLAPHSLAEAVSASTAAEVEAQYGEVADLAWRSLRRLGVPEALLGDAVQDTLLVVHRRRAEFRGEASFRTWVYGIVLRVASNYRRSAGRASAVFDRNQPLEVDAAPSAAPSPFEHLEQRAATELLHRLLDELPEVVRDVFVLVELEELSVQGAASALGIGAATCKSRLRTARRVFDGACTRERARRDRSEVK